MRIVRRRRCLTLNRRAFRFRIQEQILLLAELHAPLIDIIGGSMLLHNGFELTEQ